MSERAVDVVVVGAGVAGLGAAQAVREAGADVVVLEARDRAGGRVATVAGLPPLELGAEFLPANGEAARTLEAAGAVLAPVAGGHGRMVEGRLESLELDGALETGLAALPKPGGSVRDSSLSDALADAGVDRALAARVRSYVEQYHAAPSDEVSARWVAAVESTGEGGGGGEQVRALDGLDRLPALLLDAVGESSVRFGHGVTRVEVVGPDVRVWARGPDGDGVWRARAAVVAVPLEQLRNGRLTIDPLPEAHRVALAGLRMGRVVKLTLRFRRPFWGGDLGAWGETAFLHADGPFPTVWTPAPLLAPTLVAWAGGPAADALVRARDGLDGLVATAVSQLAGMFRVDAGRVRSELHKAAWHGWSADPWSGGGYPYARVGAAGAGARLATPIDDRVFITGDATAGEVGTVEGALAAGRRAARQVLAAASSFGGASGAAER